MTLKNLLAFIIIAALLCVFIFKSYTAIMVMVIAMASWFGLDVYQNTIEEWR